jgi:heme exporter protein D
VPEFQFDSFAAFLAMGDYAIYVWPVYILFALFFVTTVLPPILGRRKIIRQLKARLERMESNMAEQGEGN